MLKNTQLFCTEMRCILINFNSGDVFKVTNIQKLNKSGYDFAIPVFEGNPSFGYLLPWSCYELSKGLWLRCKNILIGEESCVVICNEFENF